MTGYDLFGDHGRNLPTPHGSGARPMYGDMGKSCRPDPNRKREYPHLYAVFLLDSHNTSYFYIREDNTYYWLHSRKDKDCLLYTSPSPRDSCASRMPSSA